MKTVMRERVTVCYEMTGIAVATFSCKVMFVIHRAQRNTSRVTGWYINYSCYIQLPGSRFELNDKSGWSSSTNLLGLKWCAEIHSLPHCEASRAVEEARGAAVCGGLQDVAGENPECSALSLELTLLLAGVGVETSHSHFQHELSCGPGSGPGMLSIMQKGVSAVPNLLCQGCPGS